MTGVKGNAVSLGSKTSGEVFEISENTFACTWKRMFKG